MSLQPVAVLLAALVAALGIIGAWNEALLPFAAWKLGLALLALGLIYEWVVVSRHWPTVRLAEGAILKLGEKSCLGVAFANAARRPIEVDYVAALPDGVAASTSTRTVTVPGASESIDELPVRGIELGTKSWTQFPARVRGPLGLARWSKKLFPGADIDVRPDTLRSGSRNPASTLHGAQNRMLVGSGMELHHLRPYRRGDSRGAIDWKATARSGELITRVFGEDQHLEIMIALDAGRTSRLEIDGMSQLSHYVNLAARFAEYVVVAEDRTGLVVFADRIMRTVPPRRGLQGVKELRAGLQDLRPQQVESNLIEAALRIRGLARRRSLVVLLTDLYDRDAHSQLARCVRMLLPKHLPIVVGISSIEVAQLADGIATSWFDPYKSLAAHEYQRTIDSNVARLKRMGAYAVTARPKELDGRVFALYDSLRANRLI